MLSFKTMVVVSVMLCCIQEKPVLGGWFEDMLKCYQNSTPCCGKMCICTEECVIFGRVCRCRDKNVILMAATPPPALPHYDTSVGDDGGYGGLSGWK